MLISSKKDRKRANKFSKADKDGDQALSLEEYTPVFAKRKKFKKSDKDPIKHAQEFFNKKDKNQNGLLSYEEFSANIS
jgi:hypothetical protein